MSRTQVQQVIVIILLVVFGAVWAINRKSTTLRPAASVVTTPAPRTTPPAAKWETPSTNGEAAEEATSLARDLFHLPDRLLQKIREREGALEQQPAESPTPIEQTPTALSPELSSLQLQGIFWGTGQPQAIINRRILSVGDTIEGAEVTAITKEGVTLSHRGQQVELKPSAGIRSGRDGEEAPRKSSLHEH